MRAKWRFFTFLMIFLGGISSASMATPTPTEQVRTTVDGVIETLKNNELDRETRRKKLRQLIRGRFDFRAMSQRTLATNWKKATPDEKDRFVVLFSDLLENTYMERIEAYTDERVEYVQEKVEKDRAMVDTLIVTKSVEIPIQYKMILRGDEWLVYDVVIEEISLIRNYRSSYREIVMKEGFEGLLARMKEKVEELKSSKEARKTK